MNTYLVSIPGDYTYKVESLNALDAVKKTLLHYEYYEEYQKDINSATSIEELWDMEFEFGVININEIKELK